VLLEPALAFLLESTKKLSPLCRIGLGLLVSVSYNVQKKNYTLVLDQHERRMCLG